MRNSLIAVLALLALSACEAREEKAIAPAATGRTADSALTLSADGLEMSGATPRQLAFGTAKAEFLPAVNAVLGPPPLPESENADCPAGPVSVVDWNGLSATFQDGRFVGWLVQDGPLKTDTGLGVASSRPEIEAMSRYRLESDSTLGPEFSVDRVGGIYNGEGPNAGVDMLFAGLTCFAR